MSFKTTSFSIRNLFTNYCVNFKRKYASGTMIPRPMEGKYDVRGIGINVLRTGTGHNVLCFPGSMGTIWTDFSAQIAGFNLNKYSMNVWDPPGYGNSRPPERTFPMNFYERDAAYAAMLIKKLEIAPCSLLGWSDGGITAILVAAIYPELVSKLVIWGANAYLVKKDVEIYQSIRDISKWSPAMRNSLVEIYGEQHLQKLMDMWVKTMGDILEHEKGDICMNQLGLIKAPTLILHGEKDPLVPRFHVDFLYSKIFTSSLHLFPEGKHNIHIKYAKEFNEAVQKFLYGL